MSTTFTTLLDSLRAASLFPSPIIPANFTPTYTLDVTFAGNKSISYGTLMRVSDVASQPTIRITPSSTTSASQSLTFMMIDPDAPTPADPKFAYWRHWIVTRILSFTTPTDSTTDAIATGQTLTPYLAPGPKDESGPHRYLFLVFAEPEGLRLEKGDVGGDEFVERRSFGVVEWVERFGLELVGVQWMKGVGDGWVGED